MGKWLRKFNFAKKKIWITYRVQQESQLTKRLLHRELEEIAIPPYGHQKHLVMDQAWSHSLLVSFDEQRIFHLKYIKNAKITNHFLLYQKKNNKKYS